MGSIHILAENENTMVTVHENGWSPFAAIEKLQFVEGQTYRIVETGSGGSEGELVYFYIREGHVERMVYHGQTFLPKDEWIRKIAQQTIISL